MIDIKRHNGEPMGRIGVSPTSCITTLTTEIQGEPIYDCGHKDFYPQFQAGMFDVTIPIKVSVLSD